MPIWVVPVLFDAMLERATLGSFHTCDPGMKVLDANRCAIAIVELVTAQFRSAKISAWQAVSHNVRPLLEATLDLCQVVKDCL